MTRVRRHAHAEVCPVRGRASRQHPAEASPGARPPGSAPRKAPPLVGHDRERIGDRRGEQPELQREREREAEVAVVHVQRGERDRRPRRQASARSTKSTGVRSHHADTWAPRNGPTWRTTRVRSAKSTTSQRRPPEPEPREGSTHCRTIAASLRTAVRPERHAVDRKVQGTRADSENAAYGTHLARYAGDPADGQREDRHERQRLDHGPGDAEDSSACTSPGCRARRRRR